jgi:hypothetical protein
MMSSDLTLPSLSVDFRQNKDAPAIVTFGVEKTRHRSFCGLDEHAERTKARVHQTGIRLGIGLVLRGGNGPEPIGACIANRVGVAVNPLDV